MATKELVDKELANLRISHENEERVLSAQLDVEAKIQKESVSKAVSNLMEEELKTITLKCVTEVCNSIICIHYIRCNPDVNLKAAARAGKTQEKQDEMRQGYEASAEKVKSMIESRKRINTAKVKV